MPTALDLLTRGAIEVKGRMPASSNITLLVECTLRKGSALAVYKPRKGERRLWDFPRTVESRVAAFSSGGPGRGLFSCVREGPCYGLAPLSSTRPSRKHYFTLSTTRSPDALGASLFRSADQ